MVNGAHQGDKERRASAEITEGGEGEALCAVLGTNGQGKRIRGVET